VCHRLAARSDALISGAPETADPNGKNSLMTQPEHTPGTSYRDAGVDEEREQDAFSKVMRPWLARTRVRSPLVTSITGLASGYFATLLHIPPGPPIALTTDGVGTKILLARQANRWEPVGIDVVANNVNDLVCVGAVPLALLDYMANDQVDEAIFEALARGMYQGAEQAGIAIPGGEIAQIGAMLACHDDGGGPMVDLVGTAMGALPPADPDADPGALAPGALAPEWRKPVDGSTVQDGDVIIGLPSSGLHSNGYSLARHALFDIGTLSLDDEVPGTAQTLADALLQPTRIYVTAAEALWAAKVQPRGLVHISGGGLLNLGRLAADVSYELDTLPAPPPVFGLIAEAGNVPASTMYATFNMGTGFCVVVSPADQEAALAALSHAEAEPVRIGTVTKSKGRNVTIPAARLTGHGDAFHSS
jgi:phosphoribosylformylglycinamidine cyclo-ligase